jgi:streptogramin lyase
MFSRSLPVFLLPFALCAQPAPAPRAPSLSPAEIEARAQAAARLRARIEAAPKLPLEQADLAITLPEGQALGMVSWVARDPKTGVTWLIQRGEKAPPVIAVDAKGKVLHAFGQGLYKIPHAIRLDPQGNVWTVDAGSSTVLKFSPNGEKLLQIDVGGQPENSRSAFKGTTDIAFAPNGRIFISDGYGNARILEYSGDGKKIHEWGEAGTGPGQFHLPHSIVIDRQNIIYVADRENGRVEKFDFDGKFLGEIPDLGRTYSLKIASDGNLWAGMQPLNEPTSSPGWIVKLDRASGKILGYVPVPDKGGLHSVEEIGKGQPMTNEGTKVIWFHKM